MLLCSVLPAALAGTPATAATWNEEFAGPAGAPPDSRRWHHDVGAGGWGNAELQRYTARTSNARLNGRGQLEIVARQNGDRFTSARLTTRGRFDFRYGTVSMRARLPAGRGLWPAFWMLGSGFPSTAWPDCGEIDVMENLGSNTRRAYGTVHGPGSLAEEGVGGSTLSPTSLSRGYHVFSAAWSAREVAFFLDGVRYATVERATYPAGQEWALDHPMFLLLNLAVGGQWPGRPTRRTAFPARFRVDWVRVDY